MRVRMILSLVAAFVLAGGVVLVVALLGDDQPRLEEGSYASVGDGRWQRTEEFPDPDEPEQALVLRYRDRSTARFAASVRNTGDDPVRLVGASILGPNFLFATRQARFVQSPSERAGPTGRQIVLAPGHETGVELVGVFTGCGAYEPGSETSSRELQVRYRDGDTEHVIDVSLRYEVRVRAPRGCPSR